MAARGWLAVAAIGTALAAAQFRATRSEPPVAAPSAEFHFARMIYNDLPYLRRPWGRGWWMQDAPEAEAHFLQGIRRLTRIEAGENRSVSLMDPRLFDYPWLYATQVGYWSLSDPEVARLREYLLRGGFLVTDDSHGPQQWAVFRDAMDRVFPGEAMLEITAEDPILRVLYTITGRTTIPGLRHLRRAPGGSIVIQPEATPPTWRALRDPKSRMVVAVNHNMDVGDAWEHADMPEYPEAMTSLAYRIGINYILYAMTH